MQRQIVTILGQTQQGLCESLQRMYVQNRLQHVDLEGRGRNHFALTGCLLC